MSLQRDDQLLSYLYLKRALRLFPGYIVVVLFFGVGLFLSVTPGERNSADLFAYLVANLSLVNFLHPTLASVFVDNPIQAVNGSLWTIKVEVGFYLTVPLFAWLYFKIGAWRATLFLTLTAFLWPPLMDFIRTVTQVQLPGSFDYQLPGQLQYFALGMFLAACLEKTAGQGFTPHLGRIALLTSSVVVLALLFQDTQTALHLPLALLLLVGASLLPTIPGNFDHRDLSYGIYLIHFPVIQILRSFNGGEWPFMLSLAAVSFITVILAMLLSRFVEQPAIAWGRGLKKRKQMTADFSAHTDQ